MATLIVEDGTIVAGANTFVDVATVLTYATDHGNTTWSLSTVDAQNAAILNAMIYLEAKPFKGYPSTSDQSLVWPRGGVSVFGWDISSDKIPSRLISAQCELAIKSLSGSLSPDLKRGGGIKRQKVDVIETEYFDGASATTTYQVIDQLLAQLLKSSTKLVLA